MVEHFLVDSCYCNTHIGTCRRRPKRLGTSWRSMERLRGAGGTVGEYAGDGQGEAESAMKL